MDENAPSDEHSSDAVQIEILTQQIALLRNQAGIKDGQIHQLRVVLNRANQVITAQATRIKQLEALLQRPHGLHHEVTWHNMLRAGGLPWNLIVKQFCRESNMSTVYTYVHPGIKFTERGRAGNNIRAGQASRAMSLDVPSPNHGDAGQQTVAFNFQHLPVEAIRRIFEVCLYKKGCLVHAVSRLDPYVKPPRPIDNPPHVFHYGKRTCSITSDGRDPNKVLAILLVCKRFLVLGVHAFYGLNTFAFSSIGEFSNFVDNIGPARRARIQHLELNFVGNQYLTMRSDEEGKWASSRTMPLMLFAGMLRLQTMVIHINELGERYLRRKYEPESLQQLQRHQTQGQPNFRATRELRKLQGLDMLHSIRGMRWMQFYNWMDGFDLRERVRDWSFVEDINNVCTLDMVESRRHFARLRVLPSVFTNHDQDEDPDRLHQIQPYHMTEDDFNIIRDWFIRGAQGSDAYDELRRNGLHRDTDASPSDSDDVSGISSDSSSDEGSNTSSDADSSSGDDSSDDSDDSGGSDDGNENDNDGDDDANRYQEQSMDLDLPPLPNDELFVPQVSPGHEGPYIDLDSIMDDIKHFEVESEGVEDLRELIAAHGIHNSAFPLGAGGAVLADSDPILSPDHTAPIALEEASQHQESAQIIIAPGETIDLTLTNDYDDDDDFNSPQLEETQTAAMGAGGEANDNDEECWVVRANRLLGPPNQVPDDTQSLPVVGSKRDRASSPFRSCKRARSSTP